MQLPFTIGQFMDVFVQYNQAIGPMPLVLSLGAVVALALAFRSSAVNDRLIAALLALLWVWTGAVYHLTFFAELNPPAYVFGAFFLIQAMVFLWTGVVRQQLRFKPQRSLRGFVGGALIAYGLAIYPVLGYALGHAYPAMPTFGAPCPTTIFTIGLLFWLSNPWPRYVLVIPVLWSAVGGSAAFALGVPEDYGLIVAGLCAVALVLSETTRRHKTRTAV